MNARELRIGNIIDLHVEGADRWLNAHPLSANDIGCIELGTTAQGIPLTPEWLERFGFVIDSENTSWYIFNDLGVSTNGSISLRIKKQWTNTFPKKAEHVHQLQNLYWCLCGEELQLKQ